MSQIILSGIGNLADNVTLETNPDLTVGAGEVLVAIEAANINPADFLYAAGWYGVPPVVGRALGNEGIGRVIRVGAGVDAGFVGARVLIVPNGEQGTWADQVVVGARVLIVPNGEQGTWADQVVVAARNVVAIGEQGDPAQLAQLSVNPLTAHVLLSTFGGLKPGDWVGQTIGNSAVGRYVIQFARRAGYKTLSIVRSEQAAEQVRSVGGDVVLIAGDGLSARVGEALGGKQLSLVLDGEGGATVAELAQSLKFGGTIVAYSAATGAPQAIGIGDLIYRELELKGWWIVNWLRNTPRAEVEATYAELAALVASGQISSAVDSAYPLADYQAALARAAAPGRNGKVLFRAGATTR
jgi:NADPH:quinone reductase-like Zn-dependent oxidoreductase